MDTISELSFEQAFAQLEAIIAQLESGELPLEEALTIFERGQALAAQCQALLDRAEQRIRRVDGSDADQGYPTVSQDFPSLG